MKGTVLRKFVILIVSPSMSCIIVYMYLINDKWEDGDMYFYPYHGATAVYNSIRSTSSSSVYLISAISILSFCVYSIYR